VPSYNIAVYGPPFGFATRKIKSPKRKKEVYSLVNTYAFMCK
jgi:hypothetical protein